MTWQQLTERDCREWKPRAIDPHDRHTLRSCHLPCMQQASYLEEVPLMWMLPLYLHVNQKSDDPDDDDEQHHWYIVKMLNLNVLHKTAFLTSLQELNRYWMKSMYYHRLIRFLINMKVQGNIHIPLQVAGLLPAWQISYKISRYVYHESFHSLQFLSVICFHVILGLGGPCFPSTCMSKAVDCTIGAFHMSIPAEPFLLQNEVQILNANPHK